MKIKVNGVWKDFPINIQDYSNLPNKPKINNIELNGNKTLSDLDIYSKEEVDALTSGNPSSIQKIDEYKYLVNYNTIDYNYAKKYFNSLRDIDLGSCSSFTNGAFFGRNYDWYYDNKAIFITNTPKTLDGHRVLGVAGNLSELTNDFVDSGEYSEQYRLIPFFLLDGINDAGLVASMNVVPSDYGENTSIPLIEQRDSVNGIMLVRYILDKFSTATEAVNYIKHFVSVFFPKYLHDNQSEIHYLISDKDTSYILEFVGNEAKIMTASYMTNFYLYGVTPNTDGTVYTPEDVADGHLPSSNGITDHGTGLERYNIIAQNINNLTDVSDARSLLEQLYYTKAYSTAPIVADPFWFTEAIAGDLTVDSQPSEFAHNVEVMGNNFTHRERGDQKTWQTVHSSVYDFENLSLTVSSQEEDNSVEFAIEKTTVDLRWESGTGADSSQTVNTGSHARGDSSVAEGEMSFTGLVDGVEDWSEGKAAHAEGGNTTAAGNYSHTEGNSTVANNPYEHAEGLFNVSHYSQPVYPSADNTIHSVGVGTNLSNRKNAVEIMQNGDMYVLGVGGYTGANINEASTIEEVVDNKQDKLTAGENITIEDNVISASGDLSVDYSKATNKPKINGVELNGDKALSELGIDIPSKTSDLLNDSGFIDDTYHDDTKADVEDIPTKTSDLTNDSGFITEDDIDLTNYYNKTETNNLLNSKVDKVTGKQLSTNDYTNAEKTKLVGIEENAQVNVQSNWNETNTSADSYIQNKPTIPSKTSDLVNDSDFITESDLDPIDTRVITIEGKIPTQATSTNQLADKEFVNSSIATNTSNFKGTFDSISELPTTGVTNNDYAFVKSTDTSGNTIYNRYKYNSTTSTWVFEYALNNSSFTAEQWAAINSGITSTKVDQIVTNSDNIDTLMISKQNKLIAGQNITIVDNVISAAGTVSIDYDNVTGKPKINNVELSGNKSLADLGIVIPTKTSDLTNDSDFIDSTYHDDTKVDKVTGKGLSTNDLTNDLKATYDAKAEVSDIPTKNSELENDSGFITLADVGLDNYYTKGQADALLLNKVDKEANKGLSSNDYTTAEKNKLADIEDGAEANVQSDWNQSTTTADDYIKNKPSIPTKTSDITNDSGFITESDLTELDTRVTTIENVIPSQATSSNQLGDKAFINSSIATNTAYFKGTYNSIAELPTTGITNNDYAFVRSTDSEGNTVYNRYKYSSDTLQWSFEYALNNSSFTAEQFASINSGITDVDVTQIGTNTTAIQNLDQNKVDFTDYATNSQGGVLKIDSSYGTKVEGGVLEGLIIPFENYGSYSSYGFITKGTLGEVFNNRVATDTQYGTMKSTCKKIKVLTQSEYDALATKDNDTIYMIKE